MESDPASIPVEVIQGNSLIVRLGEEKRLQRAYVSSERILLSYLQWIQLQNGKFLWVTSLRLSPQKLRKVDNFILYTPECELSVCSKIVESGSPWRPHDKRWIEDTDYLPVLDIPESKRIWIKCGQGRPVRINPADYQLQHAKNGKHESLLKMYEQSDKAPYQYVEVIPELRQAKNAKAPGAKETKA